MSPAQQELVKWERREYRRRSRLLRLGHPQAQIDWVSPEYRVTWSEVCAKADELGLEPGKDIVSFRLWWATARRSI